MGDPTDELRSLATRYASAADRRDVDEFLTVFVPDAVLEVWRPGDEAPSTRRVGQRDLAGVPIALAERYTSTDHRIGATTHSVHGSSATGHVVCEAHHITDGAAGATDDVMDVHYDDIYALTPDGWRIAHRVVRIRGVVRVELDPPSGVSS